MNRGTSIVSPLPLKAITLEWKSWSRYRIMLLILKILPAHLLMTDVKEKMAHFFWDFFFPPRYNALKASAVFNN